MLIGQTNDVSFRVNVMGTSTEPKVRVLLSTSPELSFPAHKVGDEWKAAVKLPAAVEPGKYDLRVEVILNNRHFTPLTKSIELVSPNAVPAEAWPPEQEVEMNIPAEITAEAAPIVEPVVLTPDTLIGKQAVDPSPVVKQKIKLSAAAVADMFKAENLKAPTTPTKIEYRPIISRDPIHSTIDKPLPITEKVKATSRKKVVEIKHELPIRLIKGEIVYE